MLERPNDYLSKKAQELGLDRADKLAEIQTYLDKKYPDMCRAVSLNEGVLVIGVKNSSVASEIRMSGTEIKRKFEVSSVRTRAS